MLTDKQKTLKAKGLGIGASNSGAVCGVDPDKTPAEVYHEIIYPDQMEPVDSEEAYWGNVHESTILMEYEKRTGCDVTTKYNDTQWSKDYPWMYCHLDGVVEKIETITEAKSTNFFLKKRWGEEGTDQVPDKVNCQAHHQMIVTGFRKVDVPVLFGGNHFEIFHIDYDPKIAEFVIEKEQQFWFEHVLKKIPPPPHTEADIDLLYPESDPDLSVTADDELAAFIDDLRRLNEDIKEMKQARSRMRKQIKEEMIVFHKDRLRISERVVDDNGNVLATWKTHKTKRFDSSQYKAENPLDYANYCKWKTVRPFLIK